MVLLGLPDLDLVEGVERWLKGLGGKEGAGMVLGQGVWVGVLDCDDVSSRVTSDPQSTGSEGLIWTSCSPVVPAPAHLGPSIPSISLRGNDHTLPFCPLIHHSPAFHVILG